MDGGLFEGWLEHVFVPALKNPSKSMYKSSIRLTVAPWRAAILSCV